MTAGLFADHVALVEASVAPKPTVAFFDLDRTLIAGYSILAMARERARHGVTRGELAGSAAIMRDLLQEQRSLERGAGPSYHRLVRRLSRSLKGISEDTLTRLGQQAYDNSIARTLYREAIELVEAHRAAGHHLVIVTAATRYQVDPIARVLGVDQVCCTGLEVVDGKFTGSTLAPLCYGEGKALAARRACKQVGATLADSWFYSDSIDDLPLLKKVGHPVAVNASEKLARHAAKTEWPQLVFSTRGRPTLETLVRTGLTAQTLAATTAFCSVTRRVGLGRLASANLLTGIVGEVGAGLAGIDVEVEGLENLRRETPAVFIFNHQSMLDALVLARLLKRDVVSLCKQEMADNPLLGPLLKQAGTIFVDRDEHDQAAVLKQALRVLDTGRSLLIAPEGTRSTLGEIQPFKHGAFYLARRAKVPVVPIVLHNAKDALPKGGLLIRPTTVRVTVLAPMHPAQMGGVRLACEAMEQEYSRILGKSAVAALPLALRRA